MFSTKKANETQTKQNIVLELIICRHNEMPSAIVAYIHYIYSY